MAQPLITNYFNKRKRSVVDDVKRRTKVLVLDRQIGNIFSKDSKTPILLNYGQNSEESSGKALVLTVNGNGDGSKCSLHEKSLAAKGTTESNTTPEGTHKYITTTTKANKGLLSKTTKGKCLKVLSPLIDSNIRHAFKEKKEPKFRCKQSVMQGEDQAALKNEIMKEDIEKPNNVIFQLKGNLSPYKSKMWKSTEHVAQVDCQVETKTREISKARKELGLMTPKKIISGGAQKELSLAEIKFKVTRSSRLTEIRNSVATFNRGQSKLNELAQKRLDLSKPQLQKFKAIELEVDISPKKGVYGSPQKMGCSSPQRSPLSPQKGPAYQCLASLAQPGLLAFPLPYTYRCLAETFRCVDTVVAMLFNRKEIVTFPKLKSAVQEMLRRNFTEHHLGQIKKVQPNVYMYHQEKCQSFKSSFNADKYELVLIPVMDSMAEGGPANSGYSLITPSCLLSRRQSFHQCLLEIVKDCHEDFLGTLDPPLVIPRSKLTRWHPGFELEQVPDIKTDILPQPPNMDTYTTAKDVLDRAKNLFHCNQRMEKALQNMSKNSVKTETDDSASSASLFASAFKGIPKTLLEKVRAKQAAKAMLAMTRSPAQDKEALQHMRLPELARILRSLFVAERKTVIPLELVLEKLANSYREQLSREELQQHVKLLVTMVPGWLMLHNIRMTEYLRLAKVTDMAIITKKLETLAAKKNDMMCVIDLH